MHFVLSGVEKLRMSVCMAAYNGSRFIAKQVESILAQIQCDDELIVVDDCSTDSTCEILRSFQDPRIKIYNNSKNIGVNRTFERAIIAAEGEYIFLSDQDDIWIDGRVEYMMDPFRKPDVDIVAANYILIDENENFLHGTLAPYLNRSDDHRRIRNIYKIFSGKMNYYGCAMAFRSNLRDKILPYPSKLECHDIWIGLVGNVRKSIVHLPEPTLLHRVHGANASIVKRSLIVKLRSRFYLLNHLAAALARC